MNAPVKKIPRRLRAFAARIVFGACPCSARLEGLFARRQRRRPTGRVRAGAKPGLLALSQIELDLSELLDGRKVDLRTAEDLSARFRDEVVGMAAVQYAA